MKERVRKAECREGKEEIDVNIGGSDAKRKPGMPLRLLIDLIHHQKQLKTINLKEHSEYSNF